MRRELDPRDNVDRVIVRARKSTQIQATPWLAAVYLAAALVIGCDRPVEAPAEAPVDQGTASLVEDDPASIVELDVNPLMLLPEGLGVVAADALLSTRVGGEADS